MVTLPVSGSTSTSQNWVEKPGAWPPALTDAALVKGREESDPAKRKQLYVDLCKKLLNDMAAAVPLLDQLSVWVIRANYPGMIFNGSTYPIITEMTTS